MTQNDHTPFIENIPAYAIGALDADDVIPLEAHLAECASCRAELAGYRAVSESLLAAVPPKRPPASLRRRLQSQLPGARKKAHPRLAWNFNRLAIGLVVVVLLALNIASLAQIRQVQSRQAELVNQVGDAQAALAMLSYPDVERISVEAENVTGSLLLDSDRNIAVLVLWDMPQLPAEQAYQVWLIDPQGGRVGAGVFRPQGDRAFTTQVIFADRGFSSFVGIGVTVEPAGGSDQPTGKRILKVDF